jgi:predicted metalloprotease with PDZ domain
MQKAMMAMLALSLVVPAVRAQQPDDKQAAARRELEHKMQQLEQQMRDLERELARMQPDRRPTVVTTRPWIRVYGGHAYLGVNVSTDKNPATDSIGAVLTGVTPGGPADQAGLKAGDVLTTFNGERLSGRYPAAGDEESEPGRKLVDFAGELAEGDSVKVDYRRGKEMHRATIVARNLDAGSWGFAFTTPMPRVHVETGEIADALSDEARVKTALEYDKALQAVIPSLAGTSFMYDRWFGMELVAMNSELGDYFGTSDGLLVIRAPDDSTLNLKSGDVILDVDGRKPTSQTQLVRILSSYAPGEELHLNIMRQKRRVTVTAKIPDRHRSRDGFDWERDDLMR